MNTLRFIVLFVTIVCAACDDTLPAKDPANGASSAEPASTTHSPSHGQFTAP